MRYFNVEDPGYTGAGGKKVSPGRYTSDSEEGKICAVAITHFPHLITEEGVEEADDDSDDDTGADGDDDDGDSDTDDDGE